MAEIRSERSQSFGNFVGRAFLVLASAEATIFLAQAAGVDWQSVPSYPGAALFCLAAVIMYGVLQGLSNALFHAVSLATRLAQALAGWAQTLTERVLTFLIETAAQAAILIVTLPVRLIAVALAPLAERRRQREELRRLYESVKHEYASFDEFVREFNREPDDARRSKRQDEHRAAPQPARDPFKDACATLGLPADGAFAEADLKQRYGAMIRAVHPDIAGQNTLAAQVNQARDIIRKRKGWQ